MKLSLVFCFLILASGLAALTHYWQGDVNNLWSNPGNWNTNTVPSAPQHAYIPSGCPFYPTINVNAFCLNLTIDPGASLNMSTYNLNVGGVMYVGGTLNMTSSADVTVASSVYFLSTGVFNITSSGAVLFVGGNLEFAAGSNISMSSGEIQFIGETSPVYLSNQSANTQLNKLTLNKAPGTTVAIEGIDLSQPFTIKGNVSLASGVSFSNTYPGNIYLKGSLSDYNISSGGMSWDNGTLIANGSAMQTFHLQGNNSHLNNLSLQNTGAGKVTVTQPLHLQGNLLISTGILEANAQPIRVGGNWQNNVGSTGFTEGTGEVCFDGAADQSLNSETFNALKLDKTGGTLLLGASTVSCASFDWAAGAYSLSGGSFEVGDLADPGIMGSITLNSGTINYHQDSSSPVDLRANLSITGGTFNVFGGSGQALFSYLSDIATLNMSSGILDFKDTGITIPSAPEFNDNISGGTIQTSGSFLVQRAGFQPTGGKVRLYGTTDCNLQSSSGSNFHDLEIVKSSTRNAAELRSNTVTASGPLLLYGDFSLLAGVFVAPLMMELQGNWVNLAGPAAFSEGGYSVCFSGTANQLCNNSEDFYQLMLDKASGTLTLNNASATITCDLYNWTQGTLQVNSGTISIGDFSSPEIVGNFNLGAGAVLNLNKNALVDCFMNAYLFNYGGTINITGGEGDCTLAGSNNAGITMNGGSINFQNRGIIVPDYNNLSLSLSGGVIKTVGSFTSNRVNANYGNAGLELYGSGSGSIFTASGTYLKNLTLNKSGTAQINLNSNLNLSGFLTITAGTLNLNHRTLTVAGTTNISGTLLLDTLSRLEIGAGMTLSVKPGGHFSAYGSQTQPATITHSTGNYSFEVNAGGNLSANYAVFEYMNSNGINVKTGSTVDTNNPMSNCTFRLGAAAGTLLQINNNQSLSISGAIFPENTWDGTYNVSKTADQGSVSFSGSSGPFAGEAFDFDVYERISWGALPVIEDLTITHVTAGNLIRLSWTYPQTVSRFRIYRSTTPTGAFSSWATTSTTSWSEAVPGAKYFYKVTAEQD